jgi:hypothetical protein
VPDKKGPRVPLVFDPKAQPQEVTWSYNTEERGFELPATHGKFLPLSKIKQSNMITSINWKAGNKIAFKHLIY